MISQTLWGVSGFKFGGSEIRERSKGVLCVSSVFKHTHPGPSWCEFDYHCEISGIKDTQAAQLGNFCILITKLSSLKIMTKSKIVDMNVKSCCWKFLRIAYLVHCKLDGFIPIKKIAYLDGFIRLVRFKSPFLGSAGPIEIVLFTLAWPLH